MVSGEDRISELPDELIREILIHLSTKDAVKTRVLSTKWRRCLTQWIPELHLYSSAFSNFKAFERFAERFFDPHEESWTRKLRLQLYIDDDYDGNPYLTRWINVVTKRRIQHLDVDANSGIKIIPLSIFTCKTLVHLRLARFTLVDPECVSLPCLKIMHLENVTYHNEASLEKLLAGSPLLEDLKIIRYHHDSEMVLNVRSQMLKRLHINDHSIQAVIDAPLLQCLRTKIYKTKNFKIINQDFSGKVDLHVAFDLSTRGLIRDILTDISRVKDLVVRTDDWTEVFLCLRSEPLIQFRYLTRLSARFIWSDLQMFSTFLESCPKLESLILDLSQRERETNRMFSTVPECLVSSLKFVELNLSRRVYESEMEAVRYFLKNSTILEKLKLVTCRYTIKAKLDILKEVVLVTPRCSSACNVFVL